MKIIYALKDLTNVQGITACSLSVVRRNSLHCARLQAYMSI